MTGEEAIRILDPETTGEAIPEIEYYGGFSGRTAAVHAVSDACILAVAALREQERRGAVRLIPWEQVDEANRRWIVDAEQREIVERGLLDHPEEPMARYLREKYPESWARAERERSCP